MLNSCPRDRLSSVWNIVSGPQELLVNVLLTSGQVTVTVTFWCSFADAVIVRHLRHQVIRSFKSFVSHSK